MRCEKNVWDNCVMTTLISNRNLKNVFEKTWICEPNDSVSDQGFGEKDKHEWWLSRYQGCKKVA